MHRRQPKQSPAVHGEADLIRLVLAAERRGDIDDQQTDALLDHLVEVHNAMMRQEAGQIRVVPAPSPN